MEKVDYIQFFCEKRLRELGLENDNRYIFQLERELANISVQNIADYVVGLMKIGQKINHNSIVYYLLGLTDTDPISEGRSVKIVKNASFPDIDTDFSINEREIVVQYFINKYGSNRVASIGSYGQAKIKMVLRDIARILDIPLQDTNDVAKALGDDVDEMSEDEFNGFISLTPADEGFREDLYNLGRYLEKYPAVREILFQLKGQLRHITKHPAGVVAVPTDIDETIPLMRHKGEMVTSWVDGITRKDLQMSGFVKFDILGLKTLTIIKEILELIRSSKQYNNDADFDLRSIERDQPTSIFYDEFSTKLKINGNDLIYDHFRRADTNGIFQFECISGETWIGSFKMKELYERFVNGKGTQQVSSLKIREKKRIRQPIIAMKKQKKFVYRVITDENYAIDSTELHKFYTQYKWSELKDLKPGDKVLFDFERKRTQYACESCCEIIDNHGLCKVCKDNGISRSVYRPNKKRYKHRYRFVTIKKILPIGEIDVYDLSVNSPHNYIANGFIVHNSGLMKSLLKDIRPTRFSDIAASTALGRPGPLDMGMHKEFAERKNGKKYDKVHKLVDQCLKDTYGVLVYQEDVMRICNIVAGFPLDLTDTVRKNLMKRTRDNENVKKAAKERDDLENKFKSGCKNNGLSEKAANDLWDYCVAFSRYGFNKSHSYAYTILSYQTMWFKHYYPLEFMVTLFSNSPKEKFTEYFSEAMNMDIKIIPVDINKASRGFTVHKQEINDSNKKDQCIMFGLSHIQGLGPAIIDVIEKTKPYRSFKDFINKTSVYRKIPKGAIEALVNAHAFDQFGTQNQIIDEYYQEVRSEKVMIVDEEGKKRRIPWQRDFDYSDRKFEHDKFIEAYSLDWRTSLSDEQKDLIKRSGAKSIARSNISNADHNFKKKIWGIITQIKEKKSKSGNKYFDVMLTDAKFNSAKLRIPLYNRRLKHARKYNSKIGEIEQLKVEDVLEENNIIVCEAEGSEYMGKVFVDAYDIVCLGNVYERPEDQQATMDECVNV